jgi:hypothetical protein
MYLPTQNLKIPHSEKLRVFGWLVYSDRWMTVKLIRVWDGQFIGDRKLEA